MAGDRGNFGHSAVRFKSPFAEVFIMRAVACILIVSGLCFAQGPQPSSFSSKTDVTMTAPPKAKV